MGRKIFHGAIIGFVAATVSLGLLSAGWLDRLEAQIWDWRVNVMKKPGPVTDRIRLIFIDQSSLDWAARESNLAWPWPRQVYAPIIDFCRRGGAKTVVFDIFFTEPSRIGVEDDAILGDAMKQSGNVVQAFFLSNEQGATTHWPKNIPQREFSVKGLDGYLSRSPQDERVMSRGSFPIPEIATNACLLGSAYAIPDRDAIIRRALPFQVFNGRFVPSLALAAYLVAHPDAELELDGAFLHVGRHAAPLDRKGRSILRYRGGSQTHPTRNAAAVIQSELRILEGKKPVIDPSFFRDAYVFIGVTAPALLDLKPTPISKVYPGVEIHATMLDNLLAGQFNRYAPLWLLAALTFVFAIMTAIVGRLCVTGWQTSLAFLLLLPIPLALGFPAYRMGYWLQIAAQEVAVALSLIGAVILNYATEGRQKRFIKGAFRHYLSPTVIDRLLRNPSQLTLGGESRELSIFFSDVQGFTGISESLAPEDLTTLLNDYLTAMTDIILETGGTIDKYEGDAIIAFWNAPLDLRDHAKRAVEAAIRCQARLAELRPAFRDRVGQDIFARIGVNTGPVVVGNMGSSQRFDYTFLGDAGNLAARLEGINKQFGTWLMISEFTLAQLGDEFAARELSRVRVVGRQEAVRVFEPMSKDDYAARAETLQTFDKGLQLFYSGKFKEARDIFLGISETDAPAGAYAEKCRALLDHPPEAWDGVWQMTEK